MKIRNILSALFVLSCLTSSTQQISSPWQWLNPKPAGYLNTKVRFTDDSIGFIFNDNGDLISTTDGGVSWSIQKKFSNAKVFDIHDSTGIIAGYTNEINISIDNGITWHKSVVGNSQIPYFKFVQVVSRDTLFALNSNNSTLYQSTDKGTTWTAVLTNSLLNSPSSFYFINSKIGFLCHSSIYKTIDGGNTWQPVNTNNSSPVLATRFLNENFGIVTLENSDMLKTTDGGISWTPINFPYRAYDLFFINEDTIFASCEQAKIYRSTNGGTSWSIVSPPSPNAGFWFFSIDFIDQNKGFVVGTSGKILSTQDGGGTWRQYSISHTEITSFSVPSSEIIYATDWWNVYKSTDTGQTWDSTNLSLSEGNKRFTHMWFRNKDTGFVVTKNNVTFYKTYNGGQTWEEYNPLPSTFGSVLAMSFVNDSIGYVCLNNSTAGTNFRTTDGGETWTFVSNAFIFFEQLDFITEQKGFGVAGHQVFLTIDSAKTFQVVLNNDNFSFNGLHFINGDTGYVYGNSGIVKRTLDGGVSWSDIKLPYGHFNGGYFFNALVGYLSGEAFNGSIIKTYDGGVTWHREFNLNLDRMVSFDKDTMMYIAGKGGSVLRQKVSGYGLDSILFKNITPCSADFSAYVSVAFGTINNIRLEYGQSGFTNITSLSPSSVSDSTVKVTSTLQNLEQGTQYYFRLNFLYGGNQTYSLIDSFTTLSLPKPTITAVGDTLISSSFSNNQWFLNGQPIPGATGIIYKATVSGMYTVQVNEMGCLSEMSDPVNVVITAIDPILERGVSVLPNPVTDYLYIKNETGKTLVIGVQDIFGTTLYSIKSNNRLVQIPFIRIFSGIYFVTINEINSRKEPIIKKVLKH